MLNLFPLPAVASNGAAESTSYDGANSDLVASNVQAALDELAARTGARTVAVIAGGDAGADARAATPYAEDAADIEAVIATALADGYRALLLVGTCTATAVIDIDTPDAVSLYGAPGASLIGDVRVSGTGKPIHLDVAVTGTISDDGKRVVRTLSATGVSRLIALTQAEYDALSPDAMTLYVITDA